MVLLPMHALPYLDRIHIRETKLFISLMDRLFDCLNVKSPTEGKHRRKGDSDALPNTKSLEIQGLLY